jgi:cysteine synthase B
MSVAIPSLPQTASSVIDLIGNTPLIRLSSFDADLPHIELWAKAEWRNPGGSVKDRGAARMIADGERSGALTRDKILIDATSGNTGIAYAMICASRGYRVRLCVPENVTPERKRILKAFGAEVVYTDPMQGSDGAIIRVKQMYAENPDLYFYPDQYNNPSNWRAHYDTTAPELLEQTGGRITHFVAGLGTAGTFMGTGRRLREYNPSITLISVQPDSPLHGLEGLKHMQTAIVPGIYDPSLANDDLSVSTEEAFELTRRLAREGLFVGISSGANLAGALRVARAESARRTAAEPPAVIVVIFCDGGEKYLSERFWDEGDSDAGRVPSVKATPNSVSALRLGSGVADAIRAHGTETYPNECCGALYGRDGMVSATYALPNTTEEGPRRRFLVRPQDYRDAEKRATELDTELLGFYHSHPDHPARPSQYDLDHAWPFFSYIIVSVRAGEPEVMTSWRLREDRSVFDEETLS